MLAWMFANMLAIAIRYIYIYVGAFYLLVDIKINNIALSASVNTEE